MLDCTTTMADQEAAPHRRAHPRSHARAVQPLRRAQRQSTTLISAELNISPGNLYYHYPAKDELINALFDRYEKALDELLRAADGVRNVEDAWLFFHMLFELIWQYRFLYRDLNDLLSKNRRLETHFQFVLKNKAPRGAGGARRPGRAAARCGSTRARPSRWPPRWWWC